MNDPEMTMKTEVDDPGLRIARLGPILRPLLERANLSSDVTDSILTLLAEYGHVASNVVVVGSTDETDYVRVLGREFKFPPNKTKYLDELKRAQSMPQTQLYLAIDYHHAIRKTPLGVAPDNIIDVVEITSLPPKRPPWER